MDNKMDKDLKQIIENAEERAQHVYDTTAAVRKSFENGRPNSSKESTVEGTLKAARSIVSKYIPRGYVRRSA